MGSGNILWKFEFYQIIFLDFIGIESLKYKEIRVSGAKLFWGVYINWVSNEDSNLEMVVTPKVDTFLFVQYIYLLPIL